MLLTAVANCDLCIWNKQKKKKNDESVLVPIAAISRCGRRACSVQQWRKWPFEFNNKKKEKD